MLIGRSKERLRVTNSIAFLRFRYQICYHFGRPKVAQYISLSSTAKQNWFAILCYSLYLFLLLLVQNQGNSGLKECTLKLQYTVYLACLTYCLSYSPLPPCPLVPPPPLDLKPLFYVDGLQTSSMAASAKIADNGWKWEDTTSYSDIIIRLYLWIALFPTSYGPARHISVWH